jgi:hypothetical protein
LQHAGCRLVDGPTRQRPAFWAWFPTTACVKNYPLRLIFIRTTRRSMPPKRYL